MGNINDSRVLITEEETDYRSALSESLFSRVGGALNHTMNRLDSVHIFNLNGPYHLGIGSSAPDGVFGCRVNIEIVGFMYYINQIGNGTTAIDIHKLSSGGTDDGSIWTTKPSIDGTASPGSYTFYDQANEITLSNPTGHTLAVIDSSFVNLNAGDALRLDLDDAQTGSNGFSFQLFYRAR